MRSRRMVRTMIRKMRIVIRTRRMIQSKLSIKHHMLMKCLYHLEHEASRLLRISSLLQYIILISWKNLRMLTFLKEFCVLQCSSGS